MSRTAEESRKFRHNARSHKLIEGVEYKKCIECKDLLTLDQFDKNKKAWDGLARKCKVCKAKNLRKHNFSPEFLTSQGKKKPGMTNAIPHKHIDGVEHKQCPRCEKWKILDLYGKRPKRYDGLSQWCLECQNIWEADRRKAMGQRVMPKYLGPAPTPQDWQKLLKYFGIVYLGGECVKCGYKCDQTNLSAFDFHHRDPSTKEFNPSEVRQWIFLKPELDKCDLMCSRCHRLEESSLDLGYIQELIDNIEDGGDVWPLHLLTSAQKQAQQ